MGTIYAKNDLPYDGDHSREVDFRVKINFASDPHTGFLKPGESGKMESDDIHDGKDYTVEAQVDLPLHRDIHVPINDVKEKQAVILRYDGDQYILEKQA